LTMKKGKNKISTVIKSYLFDVNYIIGLFSFSLFISCLSLNNEVPYVYKFTQQKFYALICAAVVFLTVVTRGNDIRKDAEAMKALDGFGFWKFLTTSTVYLIGFVALIMLGFS
jgi:hypothetical protein